MSESLQNQTINDTYTSLLHTKNAAGIISSGVSEIYDGIGNKSALNVGRAGNGVKVTGQITCDTLLVTGEEGFTTTYTKALIDVIYPIGSLYMTMNSGPPPFVETVWERVAEGKFIAGEGTAVDDNNFVMTISAGNGSDTDLDGEYVHVLSAQEMPSHTHTLSAGDQYTTFDNPLDEDITYLAGASQASNQSGPVGLSNSAITSYLNPTGGDTAHNNIPPWFGAYVWKRIN